MGQGNSSQTPVVTQCFGLPGEPLCNHVFHGPRHRAVMRNPRDVIFNFETGNGATYKLHSPHDYFYDVKNKRRVKDMTFKDGQMTHIWVDRFFKGDLELHHGSKIIARYNIAKLAEYSGAKKPSNIPAEKPLPIIIGAGKVNNKHSTAEMSGGVLLPPEEWGKTPVISPLEQPKDILKDIIHPFSEKNSPMQAIYIVEVTKGSIPKNLIDKVGNNEAIIDRSDVDSITYGLQMATGTGFYLWDNRRWIPEVWSTKLRLVKNEGKYYAIFKGDPRSREYLTGTRYGIRNPKVAQIFGGAGNPKIMAGIAEEMGGQFRGSGGYLFAFWTGVDIGNWYDGYNTVTFENGIPRRERDFSDLGGLLTYDTMSTLAIGAVTWGAKRLALTALTEVATGTLLVPGGFIVIGCIVLGFILGGLAIWANNQWHITDHIASGFRKAAEYLEGTSPKDYNGYSKTFVLQNG